MFKIGTLADWFGKGIVEGIRESRRCGAGGVQIYAKNEFDPRTVKPETVRAVRDTAGECEQQVTALCGELGGHGLEIAADNPQKIDYLKRVADLALEVDCRIVTTHIGIIPAGRDSEKYAVMQRACVEIGAYAASLGAVMAIETGPEPVARLKAFVDACNGEAGSRGIGINYDPANLVMVTGDDEVKGVRQAGLSIVHTHAKDGRMNLFAGPEEVYRLFAQGEIEILNKVSTWFTETPLGQGAVRWLPYLRALKEIGYDGYLTIEREVKENAAQDIFAAVNFLKELIPQI
ncbi:MAG: sugar phosphate isomerase/epimerase [Spirochaetaceae bacterium]|jgi:sugar phosphate isomerase/epimerase|nr:sugar phosphate isomerase/epimerase [Spirochaetaceae bacterium]